MESLRLIFRQALTTVLAASPTLAAGCAGDHGLEAEPGFVPMTCSNGEPQWLARLKPEPVADYLDLQEAQLPLEILESFGSPCATATDRSVCMAALGSAPTDKGFVFGQLVQVLNEVRLRATRGDEVILSFTPSSVIDFLAPIDSHGEAVLLAQLANCDVQCDRGGSLATPTGFSVQAFQRIGCYGHDRLVLNVTRDGHVSEISRVTEVKDDTNCVVGRRPAGLSRPSRRSDGRTIGGYFADAARLEAASVPAFERLGAELRAHGAPRALERAARSAALDEVMHARLVGALARRYGGVVETPNVRPAPVRDLEDIALENVAEGCVRETFGALVGRWQARLATDCEVRRAYRRVAEDELRHAALAWSVARWVEPRLTHRARRRVEDARREAVRTLLTELSSEPSSELRRVAGVPGAHHAAALARSIVGSLGLAGPT